MCYDLFTNIAIKSCDSCVNSYLEFLYLCSYWTVGNAVVSIDNRNSSSDLVKSANMMITWEWSSCIIAELCVFGCCVQCRVHWRRQLLECSFDDPPGVSVTVDDMVCNADTAALCCAETLHLWMLAFIHCAVIQHSASCW